MRLSSSPWVDILVFLPLALAVGPAVIESRTESAKRAQVTLADGKTLEYNQTTTEIGLSWQSTGILIQGCNNIAINDCYSLLLTDDPNSELDPNPSTPRQRIEFLTAHAADGTSHSFTWKYYLSSQTGTSSHFFHTMQIFSIGDSGPVITLDAIKDKVQIVDITGSHGCPSAGCPGIALEDFVDRVTLHSMSITYGPNGKMSYTVKDQTTGSTMIAFSASGDMGKDGTYVKIGMYRATFEGMTVGLAALGDWTGV